MGIQISNQVSEAARKDIRELEHNMELLHSGEMPEEKFAHFRLTRGVYGQRQQVETPQRGIQMFRIKIPFGRLTSDQLVTIADIAEQYTNGNLHTTTRQDIQLHYIKLKDTPLIHNELESNGLTAREACGNTVRNITGSPEAGIDPDEAFDISPYGYELFRYFLRNPICQEMGRKFKAALSSSEKDTAYTYMHDLGVIPRVRTNEQGVEERGFKVFIGGGLGAQPRMADVLHEFLPEDQLIPLMEALLRVFDRHGERVRRQKARMKFLVKKLGLEPFMALVKEEWTALETKSYVVDRNIVPEAVPQPEKDLPEIVLSDEQKYEDWLRTNVFEQKQKGFYAVRIKLVKGDIHATTSRALAQIVQEYAADDIRVTPNQGLLIKFMRKNALPHVFNALNKIGLAEMGFGTIADVTTCPGTDTCNLGVTNSMTLAEILGNMIEKEYRSLIFDHDIQIKMSGCMNSCGQHMVANIGLHGSSIRNSKLKLMAPAMQIVLGGGLEPDGTARIAEKVVKVPTKKTPQAIRLILDDYETHAEEGEYFNYYYRRQGKMYFYHLLKPLADLNNLVEDDYIDWGHDEFFKPEIGIGECAGVSYDVIGGLIQDAEQKLTDAQETMAKEVYAEAIYHSYNSFVVGAKALLLSEDKKCNTQIGILKDFDTHFVDAGHFDFAQPFKKMVLEINQHDPNDQTFAHRYFQSASDFMQKVKIFRQKQVAINEEEKDKLVVNAFYKA